jgi:hypothetical protein
MFLSPDVVLPAVLYPHRAHLATDPHLVPCGFLYFFLDPTPPTMSVERLLPPIASVSTHPGRPTPSELRWS